MTAILLSPAFLMAFDGEARGYGVAAIVGAVIVGVTRVLLKRSAPGESLLWFQERRENIAIAILKNELEEHKKALSELRIEHAKLKLAYVELQAVVELRDSQDRTLTKSKPD